MSFNNACHGFYLQSRRSCNRRCRTSRKVKKNSAGGYNFFMSGDIGRLQIRGVCRIDGGDHYWRKFCCPGNRVARRHFVLHLPTDFVCRRRLPLGNSRAEELLATVAVRVSVPPMHCGTDCALQGRSKRFGRTQNERARRGRRRTAFLHGADEKGGHCKQLLNHCGQNARCRCRRIDGNICGGDFFGAVRAVPAQLLRLFGLFRYGNRHGLNLRSSLQRKF